MTGRKLALLAASLAGGAVLTWTVYETLHDGPVAQRTADDAAAASPITRMVARLGPPERARTPGWDAWGSSDGWDAWSRAAAELAAARGLRDPASDGNLGDRRGRSFWDGWADLDGVDGTGGFAARDLAGGPNARRGEGGLRGHPYRALPTGQRTILTSGRRIGDAGIRLPHNAAVSLGLDERERVPMRIEVCVNTAGKPDEVRVIEGTGVDAVDNYVAREMLADRYRPLWQNGRPVAFCERTTVILGT